jgi:hypothetical protein
MDKQFYIALVFNVVAFLLCAFFSLAFLFKRENNKQAVDYHEITIAILAIAAIFFLIKTAGLIGIEAERAGSLLKITFIWIPMIIGLLSLFLTTKLKIADKKITVYLSVILINIFLLILYFGLYFATYSFIKIF